MRIEFILVFIGILIIGGLLVGMRFIKNSSDTPVPPTPVPPTPVPIWQMFKYNKEHIGRSIYKGSDTNTKKWEFPAVGSVISSPSIESDGTIYVGSGNGNLYAINPDGTKKWEFATGNSIFSSPAIGSDGTIYVGSGSKFYAIGN